MAAVLLALLGVAVVSADSSFKPRLSNMLGRTASVDTSNWVGAEYQPSKSANEDWLFHYDNYKADIERELPLVKEVMGFTTFRVFLHSMVYFRDPKKLLNVIDDFLSIAEKNGISIGFVFFDDCWNHAGLDLNSTCVPKKGVHNGCWMASPQDSERTAKKVDDFKPYVTDIVAKFKDDKRVLWWEVFNEPHVNKNDAWPQGKFSEDLRHAAFEWTKNCNPSQPVINCWDEASDEAAADPVKRVNSELNDHHQYNVPWGGTKNGVFGNSSGLMKGGIVTEAGARWYQNTSDDAGSPLTVIDWLTKLRANPEAAFVPGVMINWEVMVSNSNTRWHWGGAEDDPEPAIPWCQFVFPDGSPVSYTEAGAIRRYITGKDDFLYFEDFLTRNNPDSNEVFHTVTSKQAWEIDHTLADGLVEMAVWPQAHSVVTLSLRSSSGDASYDVVLDAPQKQLLLTRSGKVLKKFDTSTLDNGILASLDPMPNGNGAWNMLRVLLKGGEISVWPNPMYPEAFKDGKFPLPGEVSSSVQALPPRITVTDANPLPPGVMKVSATNSGARIDYISVLPPKLYGLAGDLDSALQNIHI